MAGSITELSDKLFFIIFTTGVLTHLFYFRLGEHHLNPQRPFYFYTGLYILLCGFCYQLYSKSLLDAAIEASLVELVHILGLFSSLVSYRLLWHPLRTFPGPWGARLSAFWFWEHLHRQPQCKLLQDLHSKYGPFVRTGPSDISIIDPKAVEIIYSSESLCTKNSFYDQVAPLKSLHTHRNKQDHAQHRRQWSPAFGDKAVRGYNDRIITYRDRLIKQLGLMDNETIDIGTWFNYFTYDVVGDLALGRSFGLLDSTENHWIVDVLEHSFTPTEFYLPVWCFRLVIPWLKKSGFGAFMTFCSDQLKCRLERKPETPNIFDMFLEPLQGRQPNQQEFSDLLGESQLIITAGGETTGTALTAIIYELARHPAELEKLRAELFSIDPGPSGEYPLDRLTSLPHLNGFVNEILRLYPPIPSWAPRKTPSEGTTIRGTYIPGNMNVNCPQWVIGRSEEVYERPLEIIPERWYARQELIKEKAAFAPFNSGRSLCIGKNLALMNIRATVSRLIMAFNFELPANQGFGDLETNARERFSLHFDDIKVIVKKRK